MGEVVCATYVNENDQKVEGLGPAPCSYRYVMGLKMYFCAMVCRPHNIPNIYVE